MAAQVDVQVDREASMMYSRLTTGKTGCMQDFGDDRPVDYDNAGDVVGIEFIGIEGASISMGCQLLA